MKTPTGEQGFEAFPLRVNEFHQITGTRKEPPKGLQWRITWGKHKGRLFLLALGLILCMRSAPLPDSILVSSSQGSGLTPGWIPEVCWIFTLGILSSSAAVLPSVFFPEHQTTMCGNISSMTACTVAPKQQTTQIKTTGSLKIWESKCVEETVLTYRWFFA
jgi:hypothetical protein